MKRVLAIDIGASGGRAVHLTDGGDSVTLNVNAASTGNYTLTIRPHFYNFARCIFKAS